MPATGRLARKREACPQTGGERREPVVWCAMAGRYPLASRAALGRVFRIEPDVIHCQITGPVEGRPLTRPDRQTDLRFPIVPDGVTDRALVKPKWLPLVKNLEAIQFQFEIK